MRFVALFVVLAGLLITGVYTLDIHEAPHGGFPNNWGGWIVVATIGLVVIGFGRLTAGREWRRLGARPARHVERGASGGAADEQSHRAA